MVWSWNVDAARGHHAGTVTAAHNVSGGIMLRPRGCMVSACLSQIPQIAYIPGQRMTLMSAVRGCRYLSLRLITQYLFRAARPRALAEYLLYILGEDDLTVNKELGKLVVTLTVLLENGLRTQVLVVNHLLRLAVYLLGCGLGLGLDKRVDSLVVVAEIRQSVAHSRIGNHRIDGLRRALKVVHGSC